MLVMVVMLSAMATLVRGLHGVACSDQAI
jgi:hypothetical protein